VSRPQPQEHHPIRCKRLSRENTLAALRAYAQAAAEHGKDSPEALAVRNRVVEGNLPLALHVGRRWIASGRYTPAEVLSIGAVGLMQAVERFDLSLETTFATYACWWIRHALGRVYANEEQLVRVPVHALAGESKTEAVREAAQAARRVCSLDKPLDHEGGRETFGDQLADDDAQEPFADLLDQDEHAALTRALAMLPADERAALESLAAGETRAVTCARMGVSREAFAAALSRARGRMRRALCA
jgi:RNA polymerase sigma factor (sigma-70 family)